MSPFFWVANPLFTSHPSIGLQPALHPAFANPSPQKLQLSRCSAQTATATLNFPGFLGASLSADYWWPILASRPNWGKLCQTPSFARQVPVTGDGACSTIFSHRNHQLEPLFHLRHRRAWQLVFIKQGCWKKRQTKKSHSSETFLRQSLEKMSTTKLFSYPPRKCPLRPKSSKYSLACFHFCLSSFLRGNELPESWSPPASVAPSAVFAYLGLSRDICLHYPLCPLLLPPTAHHLSSTKVEKRKLGCIVHGRRILFSLQLICFWAALKQRIQTRYIIVWGQTKPQNLLSCHVMAIYFSNSSLRNPCWIIKSTRYRYILIGYSCVLFTFYQNWAKDVWTF